MDTINEQKDDVTANDTGSSPPESSRDDPIGNEQQQTSSSSSSRSSHGRKRSSGLGIVDGSSVFIPNDIPFHLFQTIKGVSYILNLEQNKNLIKNLFTGFGDSQFWSFWEEYIEEYSPTYNDLADSLKDQHCQTALIICLNEYAPSERALPILERIVDELKVPKLQSIKHLNHKKKQMYDQQIRAFYQYNIPDFITSNEKEQDPIIESGIFCKVNQQNPQLSDLQFELLTVLIDIWDRINVGCHPQLQIDHISQLFKGEFTANLEKDEISNLCQAITSIKHSDNTFFKSLKDIKNPKIDGNLKQYQVMTLGFIKFIKGFICESDDGLHRFNHIRRKTKKSPKDSNKQSEVRPEFDNNNFPLQFDLVILGEKKKSKYFLDDFKRDRSSQRFHVGMEDLTEYTAGNEQQYIEHLRSKMVSAFQYVLHQQLIEKMKKEKQQTKPKPGAPKKIREKKRDDRYVVVIDAYNQRKLFVYPPFIGSHHKIKHRKKGQMPPNNDSDDDSPKNNDEVAVDDGDDEEEEKEEEELVDHFYSLMSYECNELSNFYLTNKCLMTSSIDLGVDQNEITMYGVNEFEFTFSAHFHVQKDWYPHPKLKFYQYFGGGGLRFFDHDMLNVWPQFFDDKESKDSLKADQIGQLQLYDDILDLLKCDEIYKKWHRVITTL